MARVKYPVKFTERVEAFKVILQKLMPLPLPNTFATYLSIQNISLNQINTALNEAKSAHDLSYKNEGASEMHREEGMLLMKAVRKDHRKCCQNLKTIFADSVRTLGDWGVTVNNKNKIVYARKRNEQAEEMKALITKHFTYAAGTSPLQPMLDENQIDLSVNAQKITDAMTAFDKAGTERGRKEQQTEERNLKMKFVMKHMRAFGRIAMSLYSDNPHKAGDLGFTIDSARLAPKVRTISLEPQQSVEYVNLKNGSLVTVINEGEVAVRPLNKPKTELIIVNTESPFKIKYGYGRCYFKNPSNTQKVKFSVTIYT
jgi:hypothetical protein